MSEKIQMAYAEGVLSGEALAFLITLEFCEQHNRLPKLKELMHAVRQDYGEALTRPTAGRGLYKARRQVLRRVRFPSAPAE